MTGKQHHLKQLHSLRSLHAGARRHTHLGVLWLILQSVPADGFDPDIQESIEMWMLLEYADKGNLEQAIQQRRFALRGDPSQLDMVRVQGSGFIRLASPLGFQWWAARP
jgi:hypothetical protein